MSRPSRTNYSLRAGLAETRDARILASEGDYDGLEVKQIGIEGGEG